LPFPAVRSSQNTPWSSLLVRADSSSFPAEQPPTSGDGLSAKDEVDVAADIKMFIFGSKLVSSARGRFGASSPPGAPDQQRRGEEGPDVGGGGHRRRGACRAGEVAALGWYRRRGISLPSWATSVWARPAGDLVVAVGNLCLGKAGEGVRVHLKRVALQHRDRLSYFSSSELYSQ
jgi:hypothetical protein